MVLATVKRVQSRRTRQRRAMVDVDVFDGSSYLHVVFFNQPWRAKQLTVGHPGRVLREDGALSRAGRR